MSDYWEYRVHNLELDLENAELEIARLKSQLAALSEGVELEGVVGEDGELFLEDTGVFTDCVSYGRMTTNNPIRAERGQRVTCTVRVMGK